MDHHIIMQSPCCNSGYFTVATENPLARHPASVSGPAGDTWSFSAEVRWSTAPPLAVRFEGKGVFTFVAPAAASHAGGFATSAAASSAEAAPSLGSALDVTAAASSAALFNGMIRSFLL